MRLGYRLSRSGAQDLLSDARFVASPRTRARQRRDLELATSAGELLDVVNRHVPGGASQMPEEVVAFVELAKRARPRTLVEIGTEACGTHLLLGHALPSLEQTIAMDLRIRNRRRVRGLSRESVAVAAIEGDSSAPEAMTQLRAVLAGRPIDVLFIDGDHSYRGAMSDLLLYRPLVRPWGLVAFHDIVPDGWLRTGRPSSAYSGEVPLIWQRVRAAFVCHEFVSSWEQEGKGIGVIENDPAVALPPLFEIGDRGT